MQIEVERQKVLALIDSGASMNAISSRLARRLKVKDYKHEKPYKINVIRKDSDL